MESSASTSLVASNTRAQKRCACNPINQSEEQKRMKLDDNGEDKEESCFNRLLEMVLDCIIRLKQIPERDIAKSISSIICEFKHGTERFSYVDLKKWENICGYLFRYGLHGASLTRIKVLEAIENCSDLQSVLKKRQLRVITLGGGPGNDTIGFCSALQDHHIRSQINVIVVDAAREWSLCVNLINSLIPEGEFGNVSELFNNNNVDMSFLNVQLPGNRNLDKKYFRKLEKTDIILMTKFISSLDWNERRNMIKSLYKEIKNEALILLIDSPFFADLWSNFDVLYISEKSNYYTPTVKIPKFQSNNAVNSNARIAVLRKKQVL